MSGIKLFIRRLWQMRARPANRATAALLTVVILASVFAAAAGVGYTASRPLLGDGSAFLGKGHTVARVSGETGQSDAEIAMQLATGKEEIQPVRLPDGRLVIVNKSTGTVSYFDSATLTPDAPPAARPASAGNIEPVATATDGYLVDKERDTVEKIALPAQPAPAPVPIPDGITAAVPGGNSLWVMTGKGDLFEMIDGNVARVVQLGVPLIGVTVADSHPVAVAEDGTAYVLDADPAQTIGNVGLTGRSLVLGAWRGAGRYVVAVNRENGQVGVLDPRTGHQRTVQLKITQGRAELDAPVVLGDRIYVPDYSGPSLWRVDLGKPEADEKPLEVPGQPGPFNLTVESGRVWANSQYDRRVLVIDANGHHHYADKGPAAELGDTEGQTGPPGTQTGTGPTAPPDSAVTEDGTPDDGSGLRVTVPVFPSGTPYRQACETLATMKLHCRPVASGDRPGIRTGDVLGTDPKGGTVVPENSRVIVRHAGPLRAPAVVGLKYQSACRQIRAIELDCKTEIDPAPALSPEQLGRVSKQDPAPPATVKRGGTVTVTYPNTVGLPSFLDQAQGAACDHIEKTYLMKCKRVIGDPVPAGKTVGQVHAQDPPAGTVAKIGDTITLHYYRGKSDVPGVVGQHIDAACAAMAANGFICVRNEGATAWGSGHAAGEVSAQSETAGQRLEVGTSITLTYYSPNNDLPSYIGQNPDAACADIQARGFQCGRGHNPYRSTNVVEGQDQGAGRHPLGSVITIRYNPWALMDLWITPYAGGNSWRIHNPPGDYRIGLAYPTDASFPGARMIYQYLCSGTNGECRGFNYGIFYSTIPSPGAPNVDPDFRPGAPFMVLMTCDGTPGQARFWRTWRKDAQDRFHYGLVHSETKPGGVTDAEELGCIWY